MTYKERVRAALAEAGYPRADISGSDDDPAVLMGDVPGGVPDEVAWKAHRVAERTTVPCWPCYDADLGDECAAGDCRTGGLTPVSGRVQ